MPNASDGMTLGGGALAYPTGTEVLVAMTGATSLTAAAHGNKTVRLASAGARHHLTLMDATTLSSGKRGFGVVVGQNSSPIPVFNAGTLGVDPVFEGWLQPGAAGQFFTTDLAAAKGNWHFAGAGFFKVPILMGGLDADQSGFFDLGGTAEYGVQGNEGSVQKIVMLTGTLGVNVFNGNDANDDVFAVPFKINVSGSAVTGVTHAAAATTVLSHATDVYSYAGGLRLSATKLVVFAYNTTQSRMEYKVLTITDASTPSVASSGTTVTDATATHAIVGSNMTSLAVVKDGGDGDASLAFWVRGPRATSGTNTQVVHYYTVSSDAITRAAEYNDAGINDTTNGAYGGYSPTAAAFFAPHMVSSVVVGIKKLNYSAGSISVAWTTPAQIRSMGNRVLHIHHVDAANGVIWGATLDTANHWGRSLTRISFNPSTGAWRSSDQPRHSPGGVSPSGSAVYENTRTIMMADSNGNPEIICPYWLSGMVSFERLLAWHQQRPATSAGADQFARDTWAREEQSILYERFFGTQSYSFGYHTLTRLIVGTRAQPDSSGGNQRLRTNAALMPRSLAQ